MFYILFKVIKGFVALCPHLAPQQILKHTEWDNNIVALQAPVFQTDLTITC